MKRTLKPSFFLRHLLLVFCLVASSYPLFWMCCAAFRAEGDLRAQPFGLPLRPTLASLTAVLKTGLFGQAYLNSLFVCLAGVSLSVTFAALAAFAFAQLRFRGKQILFFLFLLGMMIPVHVTLIPLNHLMSPELLGLKGTLWALIGPYIGFALPISILILRGAFEGIPRDLLDAARIDGCGPFSIFRRIALPLVRPALATVVIFNMLTMWNEFAFALTLLTPDCPTLPLAISRFRGEFDIDLSRSCAALTVSVLPLLLVYAFAQKHIIRGLTAGAVKE